MRSAVLMNDASGRVGIERVHFRDARITPVMRRGSCLAQARVCESCDGTAVIPGGECGCAVLSAAVPTTRLLEPWELPPTRCTCPWCRWASIVAEQRRAREPQIESFDAAQNLRAWPDSLWVFYERPDLREIPAAARRVIPLLMGPSWWLRPTVPRRFNEGEGPP